MFLVPRLPLIFPSKVSMGIWLARNTADLLLLQTYQAQVQLQDGKEGRLEPYCGNLYFLIDDFDIIFVIDESSRAS